MKTNLKFLALTLCAAALVAGCASTGTIYKYQYEGKNLLGTYLVVNLNIHDSPEGSFVEFETPTRMEFCLSGKLPAVKSIDGDLMIFTLVTKNVTCEASRFVVLKSGKSYRQVFDGSNWIKMGGGYKVRN